MSDLPGQPNLSQLLEATVDAAAEQMRVAIPGVIQSVAADLSTASVLPAVRRADASSADPVLPDVPLLFPRFGTGAMTWPVEAGDPCLLVFGDRSLEEWVSAGGSSEVEPADPRTHDLTDAVALPLGLGGAAAGREADVSLTLTPGGLGQGTAELRLQSDGNVALGNSSRSGTYKDYADSDQPYSGASEVVDLLVQALDALASKSPLVETGGGTVTPTKFNTFAELRAKANAIKGSL